MQVADVMSKLESMGSSQTVNTYRRHGAHGELFGVRVGDLKKILKEIKGDQQLAMQLWDTGNSDAMYLASLAADGRLMTRRQLDVWAKSAWWYMLSEYAVPFVAAEHPEACHIASKWMGAKPTHVVTSGWATYAMAVATCRDDALDFQVILELLQRVEAEVHSAPNRVRYCMNGFVISVGAYVMPLLKQAKATAKRIGPVQVEMGDTACKVPLASEAIQKIESLGRVGKKRKTSKC